MTNDKIDDPKRTTKGAVEKNQQATREVVDTAERAADETGAVGRLEGERDAIEDDYVESLRATQSAMDQQGDSLAQIAQRIGDLWKQILLDRRAFLGGMALAGAAYVERTNLLPTDGSYDPLKGQEHNSEQPHDDWDLGGLLGEQGYKPHAAAEGAPGSESHRVINETISRKEFRKIFPNIVKEDRGIAQQIMGPEAFDRYYNGKSTEMAEVNVNYHPGSAVPDDSKMQVGLVQKDQVGDLSDISDGEISYSGWTTISDRAAQALVQEHKAYKKKKEEYGN